MHEKNKKIKIKLGTAIGEALPDKRLIKLSEHQIEALKSASKVALAVIAAAGIITVAAAAPNVLGAINLFLPKGKKYRGLSHKQKIAKVAETFYYLKRSGLVRFKQSGKDWFLSLTPLGKSKLPKLEISSLKIIKPKKWDNRWWMVAADIPSKDHKKDADRFRFKLKQMGFFALQRTLWLYPFEPSREIEFIAQSFNIPQFVTVMKIEQIDKEDEALAKEYFKQFGIL